MYLKKRNVRISMIPVLLVFLLTDQQGKFALGIGGYLKTTMEYDFNGIVDDVDFIPALIPQPGSTSVRNQFQMDASTSTIFLKLVGRTKHLGNFIVYTAGNFRGSGKTFELQNAYAQFLGFTIGYSYGSFMDLSACLLLSTSPVRTVQLSIVPRN